MPHLEKLNGAAKVFCIIPNPSLGGTLGTIYDREQHVIAIQYLFTSLSTVLSISNGDSRNTEIARENISGAYIALHDRNTSLSFVRTSYNNNSGSEQATFRDL